MNQTNWLPGIVVLACGLFAGVLYVLFTRPRGPGTSNASEQSAAAADLDERYRLLISQLKELVADRHLHTAEVFAARKAQLEQEAAAALRARDCGARSQRHEVEKAAARAERLEKAAAEAKDTFFGRRPALKGALWGGGTVVFFVVLGLLLSQESKERTEGAEMTGKNPNEAGGRAPMQPAAPQEDPSLRAALARVSQSPDDIEANANVTHELIRRQDFEQAAKFIDRGIGLDPFHVETRIHRAVLDAVIGKNDTALTDLEHLANRYPGAHEALLFAGVLRMEQGDKPRALNLFERYVAEAPRSEQPPMIQQGIDQLRQELGAGK